jgi:hypothetical protein
LYGVGLSVNELRFHRLSFECSTEEGLTSIRYLHKQASPLQQIIFQSEGLAFIGINIITNRFAGAKFTKEKETKSVQRFIEITLNQVETYKMDYDKIKQYQTKEILGIFSVKDAETKGLKILGEVYEPDRPLHEL